MPSGHLKEGVDWILAKNFFTERVLDQAALGSGGFTIPESVQRRFSCGTEQDLVVDLAVLH